MKIRISLAAVALALLSFSATPLRAQYEKPRIEDQYFPKNVIRWNPLGLIFGNYTFFYERVLPKDRFSLQLGGNYMTKSIGGNTDVKTDMPLISGNYGSVLSTKGWGVTPEFRYYWLQDITKRAYGRPAPYGLYIGAYARYMHNDYYLDINIPQYKEKINFQFQSDLYSLGAIGGFQGIIAKHVSIDLFIGPDINYISAGVTQLPQFFDDETLEGMAFNWAIDYAINQIVGSMDASTTFPGVRAGFAIGAAF